MNHNDEKILKALYREAQQEQPPAALDQMILHHAKKSNQVHQKRSWRPWLAAASVVLAVPIIWLLVQNDQLLEQQSTLPQSIETIQPKPVREQRQRSSGLANDDLTAPKEQMKSSSKPVTQPVAAPVVESELDTYDFMVDSAEEVSSEPEPQSKSESIAANRELLLNEFKAKKKTLKPSNLDPLLALELQQFELYIEEGKIEQATQLLTEIQAREPDFDYSELEQRLLNEQSNQD